MQDYIFNVLKAVHTVPIKDGYIADYVSMRIFNILSQDCFLRGYLVGNEVDIPDFMKCEFNNN